MLTLSLAFFRLHLLGWTQEEIGATIGLERYVIKDRYFLEKKSNFENLPISSKNSLTGLPASSEFGQLELHVKQAMDSGPAQRSAEDDRVSTPFAGVD